MDGGEWYLDDEPSIESTCNMLKNLFFSYLSMSGKMERKEYSHREDVEIFTLECIKICPEIFEIFKGANRVYYRLLKKGVDTPIYREERCKRVEYPLVMSGWNNCGVWSKKSSVTHYFLNQCIVYDPSKEFSLFNWSRSDILILVIEFDKRNRLDL